MRGWMGWVRDLGLRLAMGMAIGAASRGRELGGWWCSGWS